MLAGLYCLATFCLSAEVGVGEYHFFPVISKIALVTLERLILLHLYG